MAYSSGRLPKRPKVVKYFTTIGKGMGLLGTGELTYNPDNDEELLAIEFKLDKVKDEVLDDVLEQLCKLYALGPQVRLGALAPRNGLQFPLAVVLLS